MPVIEITIPQGSIAADRRQQLIANLSEALFKAEGLPDSPRVRSSFLTYLHEAPVGTFAVDGKVQTADNPARYRVVVTIPQYSLNDERKKGLVEEVTRVVLKAEGVAFDDAHRFRVLCLIVEINDGNWGSGGQPLRLTEIAAVLGVEPSSPRYQELAASR